MKLRLLFSHPIVYSVKNAKILCRKLRSPSTLPDLPAPIANPVDTVMESPSLRA